MQPSVELQDVRRLDPDDPLLEREHRPASGLLEREYRHPDLSVPGPPGPPSPGLSVPGSPGLPARSIEDLGDEREAAGLPRQAPSVETLNYRYHSYDPKKYMVKQEKYLIRKNLVVICICFMLNFTAFQSMQNLQSSVNSEGGLGLIGLSVIYLALVLSSLFLPTLCIRRCGCKWSLSLSFLPFVAYSAANFYPAWATIVPTAFALGVAAAIVWAAKCTYLTSVGEQYARLSGESKEAVITRFFGYFFMVYQTSQIWGNLISSFILQDLPANGTFLSPEYAPPGGQCGKFHCAGSAWDLEGIANANLQRPSEQKMYILCGVLTSLGLAAFLGSAVCLDRLKKRVITEPIELMVYEETASRKVVGLGRQISATARHCPRPDQLLLIPITVYCGLEQAFLAGTFTKSYVSCSLGIWMVGMVLICFGVTNSLCSLAFGRMAKHMGHPLILSFGALCHCGCLLGLFFWEPRPPEDLYLFFVLAALWGMADAVWQTQVGAFYGCVFLRRKEAAFSNYRLWESLGYAAAFAYSGFLCTYVQICVLLGTLALGMLGYFVVECRRRYLDIDAKGYA